MSSTPKRYRFKDFCVDVSEERFYHKKTHIPLEYRVFQTLFLLIKNPKTTISKSEFIETIWEGAFVEEGNLSVAIAKLRKAFREKDPTVKFIETVPRKGYRFNCPVIIETEDNIPRASAAVKLFAGRYQKMIGALILIFLIVALIVAYFFIAGTDKTPSLKKAEITSLPDNARQLFVNMEGNNFDFDTVKVRVIGLDCTAEDPCEVPNNVLKKFSVIKATSIEHVPLTLPPGEFEILVQNGNSAMSDPVKVNVP